MECKHDLEDLHGCAPMRIVNEFSETIIPSEIPMVEIDQRVTILRAWRYLQPLFPVPGL